MYVLLKDIIPNGTTHQYVMFFVSLHLITKRQRLQKEYYIIIIQVELLKKQNTVLYMQLCIFSRQIDLLLFADFIVWSHLFVRLYDKSF